MEILVTSSIISYLKILYPHMGPPTTPGPQASHHLNPALPDGMEIVWNICRLLDKFRSFQHHALSNNFLTCNFACSSKKHVFLKSFYFNTRQNHTLDSKSIRAIANF